MAVLCGSTGIFAVIDMEGSNLIFSQHLVEVCDYPVKIVDNIITTVMGMAGIEADTEPVFFHYAVINPCQLLKISSNLRTFSSHGFRATIQFVSSVSTSFNPFTIEAIPASTPAPT